MFFSWLWFFVCSYFFFFSSRRRHTRSYGDWSSDVCSSDLGDRNTSARPPGIALRPRDLFQQPMALLVGQHEVSALGGVEQRGTRRFVVRVVPVRLEPVLHVGQPGHG